MSTKASHIKRLDFDEDKCRENCNITDRDILIVERLDEVTLRLTFNGPEGTEYFDQTFMIRYVAHPDYSFKVPNLFLEGPSPDHRFYLKIPIHIYDLKKSRILPILSMVFIIKHIHPRIL